MDRSISSTTGKDTEIVDFPSLERTSGGRSWRVAAVSLSAAIIVLALFLLAFYPGNYSGERFDGRNELGFGGGHRQHLQPLFFSGNFSHRKLLQEEASSSSSPSSSKSTERVGEACSKDDIVVHQGATTPLPSGIPTYTVEVLNVCAEADGCSMAHIHFSCGWFSSARLVNPRVFRRLRYDDCLLNDGRPLPPGSSLSFQYANSFRYPLAVASASCAP